MATKNKKTKTTNRWNKVAARSSVLASGVGTSSNTFAGVVSYAKLCRPKVILLENVDQIASTGNEECMWTQLADIGYHGSLMSRCSSNFGLPQARSRTFILVVLAEVFGMDADTARRTTAQIFSMTDMFRKPAPP